MAKKTPRMYLCLKEMHTLVFDTKGNCRRCCHKQLNCFFLGQQMCRYKDNFQSVSCSAQCGDLFYVETGVYWWASSIIINIIIGHCLCVHLFINKCVWVMCVVIFLVWHCAISETIGECFLRCKVSLQTWATSSSEYDSPSDYNVHWKSAERHVSGGKQHTR